jgi:tetratricopeptide (TPR) repeat protein
MEPNSPRAHLHLGQTYEEKGMYEEAIKEFQKSIELSGQKELLGIVGHAYGMAGKRDEALKILKELITLSRSKDVIIDPDLIAAVYIGLGEKDPAFEWLNKAIDYRSGDMPLLKSDPVYDPLRSDPRFADLLRRVGLPP